MTARRAVSVCSLALVLAALALPSNASAFKLVKASGLPITKHTEIHFTLDAEVGNFGNGFKCELNGYITTKNGTNVEVEVTELITKSCKPTGTHFLGCIVFGDSTLSGPTSIDENAFTTDFSAKLELGGIGCETIEIEFDFEPLKIIVGIGAINFGIIEGEGEAVEVSGVNYAVTASGEMTLGQYTEAGVNKGSAKGVFKIVA